MGFGEREALFSYPWRKSFHSRDLSFLVDLCERNRSADHIAFTNVSHVLRGEVGRISIRRRIFAKSQREMNPYTKNIHHALRGLPLSNARSL